MNDVIMWSPGVSLEEVERQVIVKAYRHFQYNKTVTANALGIAINTLSSKLEKYEVDTKAQEQRNADDREKRIEFQRRARGIQTTADSSVEVYPGLRDQSAPKSSEEHAVSMSERKEIQKLPPKSTSSSGSDRRR